MDYKTTQPDKKTSTVSGMYGLRVGVCVVRASMGLFVFAWGIANIFLYDTPTTGKIVSTTTQTASTTPWTSSQTSQMTTALEKETVTTSITTRNTVSPTITVSSHSSSSLSSTSTGQHELQETKALTLKASLYFALNQLTD